jgi:hypothetical protein
VKTLRRLVFPQAPSPIITNFLFVTQISMCTSPFLSDTSEEIVEVVLVAIETSGALRLQPLTGRCLTDEERGERETIKSGQGPMCSGLKIAGVVLGSGAPMQVIAQGRGGDNYQIFESGQPLRFCYTIGRRLK